MSLILNYRDSSMSSTVQALLKTNKEFEKAKSNIQDQKIERCIDFVELQDFGNPIIYNNARRDSVISQLSKNNNSLISSSLGAEERAINSLQDVLTKFQSDYISAENTTISKKDICDQALKKIQDIINFPQDGKYIFGGANAHEIPISGDLRITSNLDQDKNFLNNYTDAVPNKTNVMISQGHNIQIGIDASNPAFASLIGVINKIKLDNDTAPASLAAYPEIATTKQSLEQLITTNIIQKQEIIIADQENESTYKKSMDYFQSPECVKSYDEMFEELYSLFRAKKALNALQQMTNNDFRNLMSIFI